MKELLFKLFSSFTNSKLLLKIMYKCRETNFINSKNSVKYTWEEKSIRITYQLTIKQYISVIFTVKIFEISDLKSKLSLSFICTSILDKIGQGPILISRFIL